MKKFLSVLLLAVSTTSYSNEIFREDFEALMLKNRSAFELVLPGMMTRTIGKNLLITDEEGNSHYCTQIVQRVVVDIEEAKYRTYERIENVDDCEGQVVAGEVLEHHKWNKLFTVEEYLDYMAKNYYVKFDQMSEHVILEGITNFQDGNRSQEFIQLLDTTKSQFDAVGITRTGPYTKVMIERSLIKPEKVVQLNLQLLSK